MFLLASQNTRVMRQFHIFQFYIFIVRVKENKIYFPFRAENKENQKNRSKERLIVSINIEQLDLDGC